MMAAEEQTTIPATAEWTSRSDAARHRAVDMLLRDPLWSLLADEAIANIAETSPDCRQRPSARPRKYGFSVDLW
jgi:hypothetical protein